VIPVHPNAEKKRTIFHHCNVSIYIIIDEIIVEFSFKMQIVTSNKQAKRRGDSFR